MQVDIAMFFQWANATAADDRELADFYTERFRAEFRPAFDAWLATDPLTNPSAPPTPFATDQYQLAARTEAERLDAEAEAGAAVVRARHPTGHQLRPRRRAVRRRAVLRRHERQAARDRNAHGAARRRLRRVRRHGGLARHVPDQHLRVAGGRKSIWARTAPDPGFSAPSSGIGTLRAQNYGSVVSCSMAAANAAARRSILAAAAISSSIAAGTQNRPASESG